MILQTGMRTDIPAFYSEWFLRRLKEGYVCVRNPFYPEQVTKYRLSPDVVDLIGFCTKNPAPMLPFMELLQPYGQYWFVTITPYGKEIEPNVPPTEKVIEDFRCLSRIVGVDSIGWRYDPIFLSETYTVSRHLENFAQMASALSGYTEVCVISFIDLYQKVKKNFPEVREVRQADRLALGKEFVRIGKKYGMVIRPCAEGNELAAYGADCSGCMTIQTCEKALHGKLNAPKRKGARAECACYLANDIGQYDTCRHFCRYCYANTSADEVKRNLRLHDPASPFLIGNYRPGDVVHEAKQESWLERQLSLF